MYFYVLIALVVGIDQWVKYYIRAHMTMGDTVAVWPGVLNLTYIGNEGAAFSILAGQQWFFVLCTIAVIIAVAYFRRKGVMKGNRLLETGVALLVGGAIGNAIDRVTLHFVTDFFELKFVHFAIFNVADIAVNLAVVFMVLHVILGERKAKQARPQEEEDGIKHP
ncbi:MAG: signal peptidase II [Tumebacillaceae bacterium]